MSIEQSFLIIDKAPELTSHDVVAMVRAVTGIPKVGHTGTLDPFATGVLPLALGGATRLIQYLDESEKTYDATISLGSSTDTGDPTGRVIRESPVPPLNEDIVREALASFIGERMQRPPAYSAVKVAGRRLYDYARAGEEVEVQPRPVRIFGMELISLEERRLRVIIRCSRGTYARVLADEIAVALGTSGHLAELSRLASGPFRHEKALTIPMLSEIVAGTDDWRRALQPSRGAERVPWKPLPEVHAALEAWCISPLQALSDMPRLMISAGIASALLRGAKPPPPPIGTKPGGRYAIVSDELLLAIAESTGGGQCRMLWRGSDEAPSHGRRRS